MIRTARVVYSLLTQTSILHYTKTNPYAAIQQHENLIVHTPEKPSTIIPSCMLSNIVRKAFQHFTVAEFGATLAERIHRVVAELTSARASMFLAQPMVVILLMAASSSTTGRFSLLHPTHQQTLLVTAFTALLRILAAAAEHASMRNVT